MAPKVFVTKTGKANITCPQCGKVKQMDAARFNSVKKEIKLKCTCTCKNVFPITLERRQHVRKPVDLKGVLLWKETKTPIRIEDVSRIGLKVVTSTPLKIAPETKVTLRFILDDVWKSKIAKEVVVKSVNENVLGMAFVSPDHYDKFGNYILFQFD